MYHHTDGLTYIKPPKPVGPSLLGREEDQAETMAYVSSLPLPVFGDAAPNLTHSADTRDVFFWECEQKLLGGLLPAHRQTIGDCVSHGWGRGVQDLLLIEIALRNEREEWQGEVATEPIYAGSRVEIGGGRVGSGDGSIGAWAAKWISSYGIILRKKFGTVDLTDYDGNRARQWGKPGSGVPDDLEPDAKLHPVRLVSLTTSAQQVSDALGNLYPVSFCSNQGFTMTRDSNGFCKASGTWNHCMLGRGRGVAKGNRPFVVIQQSWGESPTGNNKVTLESGKEILLPQGCFAVDMDTIDRMARQEDTFSMGHAVGWESRQLDFMLI